MMSSIRCCISCILPCGSLDVIRIVHTNGYVEELSGTVFAEEIMKLNPKHVLKKPSSSSPYEGCTNVYPQVVIMPPEAQLQRGKIYFLMPVTAAAASKTNINGQRSSTKKVSSEAEKNINDHNYNLAAQILSTVAQNDDDHRRRGRSTEVWRPQLDSIPETPILYDS